MENRTPTRREKRLKATREQILAAAAALIAARGFEATTVEDIAERADVAKGTLYYHFSSKEEIAVALGRAGLVRVAADIEAALAAGTSPCQVLRNFFLSAAAWIEAHPELARVAVLHSLREAQENGGACCESQPSTRAILRRILAAGQAAGELRSDFPAEVLMLTLAGAYVLIVFGRLLAGKRFPLADRLLECLVLFLEGAQAPKG